MLFKSGLLTQASGSIGGLTASRNRGGMYFRARAIPTDPSTPFQTALRGIFSSLAGRWNTTLTPEQREEWDVYASLVTLPGPLGDPITISGQNHFIRSNTPLLQAGEPVVDDAPTQFDTGDMGVVGLANALQLGDEFDVTFDNTLVWANNDFGKLLIYIGRPQNPSISYFRGPWRFVSVVSGSDTIPPTSPETFVSPFVQTSGQRLWLRTRAASGDGRLSEFSIAGPVVVG